MVTVTLIRHGESVDNTKSIWAGWKDSPLSALGERQAAALGTYFHDSSIRFTHIYASDLLRAHSTALAVLDHHADPKPPMVVTQKLREQHFGVAEGQPWALDVAHGDKSIEEYCKEGIFPEFKSPKRDLKFPGGESLDDVAHRVEEAIKEFVLPHIFNKSHEQVQIAFGSHGLCISETISALLRLDPEVEQLTEYRGHQNTGWSQLEVSLKGEYTGDYDPDSLPPFEFAYCHSTITDTLLLCPLLPLRTRKRVLSFLGAINLRVVVSTYRMYQHIRVLAGRTAYHSLVVAKRKS